jgi:hypothetical protein
VSELAVNPQLLRLARQVLERNRFRVQERELPQLRDVTWLVAESEYFILGVAAGASLDDVLVLEGFVAEALGALLDAGALGAKRWDSYVVLLASSGAEQRGQPTVVGLEQNTRALRRLVALGTAAHEDAVATALATFLPLPAPPVGGLRPPFDELVSQLVLNGVDPVEAGAAVDRYRRRSAREHNGDV